MRLPKTPISAKRVVMLAHLAAAGFGFVTFFVLLRTLGLTTFGEWTLYLTAFNLVEMFRTGLIRQALVHHSSSERNPHSHFSSAFYLTLFLTVAVSIVLILFRSWGSDTTGIGTFINYYPFIAFLTILPGFDTWVSQSNGKHLRMALLTLAPALLFAISALLTLWLPLSLLQLVWIHGGIRLLLSLVSFITSGTIDQAILKPNFKKITTLWKYGRFSLVTLMGTNLLKSADNFLIGYFLGPAAVALYSVPLKLLELAEIPVRSTAQVVFPRLSSLFNQSKITRFLDVLRTEAAGLTKWYLPAVVVAFAFAEQLVQAVGGAAAASSAWVLRIFLIYALLLPTDRLFGVAIDSTGRPKLNALKVWAMVIVNIVGDVLVLTFTSSLEAVAAITVANALMGVYIGRYLLQNQIGVPTVFLNPLKRSHANAA